MGTGWRAELKHSSMPSCPDCFNGVKRIQYPLSWRLYGSYSCSGCSQRREKSVVNAGDKTASEDAFLNEWAQFPLCIYLFIELIAFDQHSKLSFILENCFRLCQSSETVA
jgi:hypothetical protein